MTRRDCAPKPVYEELPGWWEDISGRASSTNLPAKRVIMCCDCSFARAPGFVHWVGRGGNRPSCAGGVCRITVTDASSTPTNSIPSIHHHGGFPVWSRPVPVRGSASSWRPCAGCRNLAVAADPGDAVWDGAAERAAALVLLRPFEADEGRRRPACRHGRP